MLASTMVAGPAAAGPSTAGCENRNLNQIDKFLECVSGEDALVHLQAFQDIADANGGTRASVTPGYDASVDYVTGLLEEAGRRTPRPASKT